MRYLSIGLIAAAMTLPAPAQADEFHMSLQVSCVPELGYFSARRFGVYNPPTNGPYLTEGIVPGDRVLADLEARHDVHRPFRLQERPLTCSIPALPAVSGAHDAMPGTEVTAVGHYDRARNDRVGSERQMINYVEVFVGGSSVGTIDFSGYVYAGAYELIEVSAYETELTIRRCKHDPETGERRCEEIAPARDQVR